MKYVKPYVLVFVFAAAAVFNISEEYITYAQTLHTLNSPDIT